MSPAEKEEIRAHAGETFLVDNNVRELPGPNPLNAVGQPLYVVGTMRMLVRLGIEPKQVFPALLDGGAEINVTEKSVMEDHAETSAEGHAYIIPINETAPPTAKKVLQKVRLLGSRKKIYSNFYRFNMAAKKSSGANRQRALSSSNQFSVRSPDVLGLKFAPMYHQP